MAILWHCQCQIGAEIRILLKKFGNYPNDGMDEDDDLSATEWSPVSDNDNDVKSQIYKNA